MIKAIFVWLCIGLSALVLSLVKKQPTNIEVWAKNYTSSKSFHVRNYLNEFELEAQDTVKPGEIAHTGWRTLTNGRKMTAVNCSIPGNRSRRNFSTKTHFFG
jgi:hypothetical protein